MKYIRVYNDEIIGYQPAPNKYQKWYRPIDTYDKKYDRNLELPEDKQEKYTDLEALTDAIAADARAARDFFEIPSIT